MFEGYTLGQQQEDQRQRGWNDSLSALSYCTVEVVVVHKPEGARSWLDWEILECRRRSDKGIADCRGRWQGKWGTQVRPGTDPSPNHAVLRCLQDFFGKKFFGDLTFIGSTGPWMHKATVSGEDGQLQLNVLSEQAESTPWCGSLYVFNAVSREFDSEASHKNVHGGEEGGETRWTPLQQLILERGDNANYLYWQIIALAMRELLYEDIITEPKYFPPGVYTFL